MRWAEGPVWFGDGRYYCGGDIPNNRIMRWDEETGTVGVFRHPSNNANGNTRDRQDACSPVSISRDASRAGNTMGRSRSSPTASRETAEFAERHRLQIRWLDLVQRSALRDSRQL